MNGVLYMAATNDSLMLSVHTSVIVELESPASCHQGTKQSAILLVEKKGMFAMFTPCSKCGALETFALLSA